MTQVMENDISSFAGEDWKFVFSEIENQLGEFEEDENIHFVEFLFSRGQGDK